MLQAVRQNHFQSVCKLQPSKQVHPVRAEQSEDESDDSLYIPTGRSGDSKPSTDKTILHLTTGAGEKTGDTVIQYQLDTGATCNVMALDELCNIKQQGNPKWTFYSKVKPV